MSQPPPIQRDYWPTQDWHTADPESAGMDSGILAGLDPMIRAQYRNIHGIVVVRKGTIIYERYYNGCGPQDAQHVASVTKSVTSALIGIAIDQGCLQSVDQHVLDFFPEYKTGSGDLPKRAITLRHLLSMTAPFAWKSQVGFEPLDRLRRQPDWITYILNLMGLNGQIGRFQYCTAGAHLLSAVLTRATGLSARAFANEQLFRPLGMREIPEKTMKSFRVEDVFGDNLTGWISDPAGYTVGGWGLTLTPRDMARFGYLYLNGGTWDNQSIVSQRWVDESTALNPNHYGYLWWLRGEGEDRIYSALGSGGSVICCIPAKDMVIAITSVIIRKPRDRWLLIENCILPAVVD